jgi:predicted O-methyltransferase YrrM
MRKTVLCHFYNEEYLLPWWLNHHKQIFDHGVMINYASTDRSCEIIREICPSWDIIDSRNPDFEPFGVDFEVMDIERQITGWKTCLNITEFLVGDYSILDNATENTQFIAPVFTFIDTDREREPDYDKPIWAQKTHGFSWKDQINERSPRSIHNYDFRYSVPGRHCASHNTEQLAIFYFGWCPFSPGLLHRKLQVQTRLPASARAARMGTHHVFLWSHQGWIPSDHQTGENLLYRLDTSMIPASRDISAEIEPFVTANDAYAAQINNIMNIESAWHGHREFANWLTEHLKPQITVDLGVDYGFSTFALAERNPGHVYGIDMFQGDEHAGFRDTGEFVLSYQSRNGIKNVTFVKGTFDQVSEQWSTSIDILHIDGLHTREAITNDYTNWIKFVHPNGIILMHDIVTFADVKDFYNSIRLPKLFFVESHGLGVVSRDPDLINYISSVFSTSQQGNID